MHQTEGFEPDDVMNWLLLNSDFVEFEMDDKQKQSHSLELSFADIEAITSNQNLLHENSAQSNVIANTTNLQGIKNNLKLKTVKKEESIAKKPMRSRPSTDSLPSLATVDSKPTQTTGNSKGIKKRPRESIEDIENKVNELRAENEDLQSHLLTVNQRTNEVQKQRTAMERLMAIKVAELEANGKSDQTELANVVNQYTDIYADYGKCRQREIAFHLNQLEKLMLPTKTTKMSLWTLQQDKSFFQKNKSPMYDILSKELELTPDQVNKIQERRDRILALLDQLKESLNLIQSMKSAIEKKHACYDAICGKVQQSVTPKQTVYFQLWINKNADKLARFLPEFNRVTHHISNMEFLNAEEKSSKFPLKNQLNAKKLSKTLSQQNLTIEDPYITNGFTKSSSYSNMNKIYTGNDIQGYKNSANFSPRNTSLQYGIIDGSAMAIPSLPYNLGVQFMDFGNVPNVNRQHQMFEAGSIISAPNAVTESSTSRVTVNYNNNMMMSRVPSSQHLSSNLTAGTLEMRNEGDVFHQNTPGFNLVLNNNITNDLDVWNANSYSNASSNQSKPSETHPTITTQNYMHTNAADSSAAIHDNLPKSVSLIDIKKEK